MRYLVGLGEDDAAHTKNKALMGVAMHHAVPGRDCLLLVRVVEELKPDSAIVLLDMLCDDVAQIKLEADTKKKLEVYSTECRDAGLDSALLVLSNDHPGVALCEAAKNHKADCIIVGRRDLGTFKRLITFSTSKYCIDNADCNVIIVKRPYSEGEEVLSPAQQQKAKELSQAEKDAQGQTISSSSSSSFSSSTLEKQIPSQRIFTLRDPEEMKRSFERAEQHKHKDNMKPKEPSDWKHGIVEDKQASLADLALAKEMEEKERKERIRERNSGEEREQILRRQESKKDLILVRKLEEEERNRRMSEWVEQAQPSKTEIKKSLADTKILEETARKEKIQALNFDDLQENEKMKLERTKSLEKIRIAEEQERQERIRGHEGRTSYSNRPKVETEKVKKLEDDEQARRIRGEQKLQRIRSQESQLDLQKVKEMEEIERGRRIESMRISQ